MEKNFNAKGERDRYAVAVRKDGTIVVKLIWLKTSARIISNINIGSPDPPQSINLSIHYITNTRIMYILTPQGRVVPCPLQ